MPTKTTKTSAKKTDAAKPKTKAAAAAKPTAKASAPAEKTKSPKETAEPAAPKVSQETVSLIDAKPKRRTRTPAELENKPFAHIPISKLLEPEAPKTKAPAPAAEAPAEETSVPESAVPAEAPAPSNEKVIHLKPPFTVKDLAAAMNIRPFQVIGDLMEMNIFASINQTIESDVATKVCAKHGFTFERETRKAGAGVHKPVVVKEPPKQPEKAKPDELHLRAPIVTFMGHVDHGKTTLMDTIRKARVAAGEAGGITQHIGAYSVIHNGHAITFLDTPGHAAFTAMRARGASVTDIVVLVVAADDGIMPQTIEAMNHAKAAKVAIIVAVTKMDTPGANLDKVKGQLQEKGLAPEDWGGSIGVCPVAALKGQGVNELLERIQLEAEVLELKASGQQTPRGSVIEAQVEQGRGPTATIIVKTGTLKVGMPFICGKFYGKVKSLIDDQGKPVKEAGPSTPCRVLGFSGLPFAGDELVVMESERAAQALGAERMEEERIGKLAAPKRATLESLFDTLKEGQHKRLKIILKTDVQGSLEAITTALGEIQSKKIDLEIVHSAVGPISESDIQLSGASDCVVIGFGVKTEATAANIARREGVQIKLFSIIYELIDQVKEAMAGLLDPENREAVIGHAEVKKVFELSKGLVAGCAVTDGRISRTARARVLRGRQPIYDGGLATLRRFQDDVKEVRSGLECGIKLGDFNDYEPGDIIECYTLEKLPQKL
ncbi:MAG: translation initiation factor IF-2 [Chthoniobacter sp.]|nr:translation initiation factor IF-2 [Chthoniobacter sp.]